MEGKQKCSMCQHRIDLTVLIAGIILEVEFLQFFCGCGFFFPVLGGINWYFQWTVVLHMWGEDWFLTDAPTADENLSRRFHMIKPRQADVIFSV